MFRIARNGNPVRPTLYIPGTSKERLLPCPLGLSVHPVMWSREDVRTWLSWCLEEFALEDVDLDKFSMNGKALCMLKKPDFNDRAKNGDVLYNTLQELLAPNKHSPVCTVPHYGHVNQVGHSPHQDAFQYGEMTPVSPHDLLAESPIAAASPPTSLISHPKSASVYRSVSRQSSHILSQSPPHWDDSPLDLSREKDQHGRTSGDEEVGGDLEGHGGTNRLSVPTTPIGRLSPTQSNLHPLLRSPRSPSPGTRRPSPSGESLSPVPLKMPRMHSIEGGHFPTSPSVHYTSNCLPTPVVNREPSPEHFVGLRQKFALTRLDSKDGHSPMYAEEGHRYANNIPRHAESIPRYADDMANHAERRKDAIGNQEDADGSEGSMHSESESATDENPAYNGHVKPVHIIPIEPDGRSTSQIPLTVNNVETADDCYDPDIAEGDAQGDTKLLWEFIYQLLRSPEYSSLVRWEDEARLVFRIIQPAELARLWGLQKSRDNMTYEKLSRALRYYYKMNIIVKEPQRRLTYRFVKPPESIQRGQKGAKPGVSHKRRVSSSPAPSPSCSPSSSSPTSSCSPSSSSPTQLPIISLTAPPPSSASSRQAQHGENTSAAVQQDNEAVALATRTPQMPNPKTYSPITARAYHNLCRQYSTDNTRAPVPWLVPPDSQSHAHPCVADNKFPGQTLSTDVTGTSGDVDHSRTASDPNLPFQNSDTPVVVKQEHNNNVCLIRAVKDKDDMIKQESLEFTISENSELIRGDNPDEVKEPMPREISYTDPTGQP